MPSRLRNSNDGAAAVEFALLAPLFVMLLLSFIATGIYLSTAYSIQQIAADAARTAIAGITAEERQRLASGFVDSTALRYPFITKKYLVISAMDDPGDPNQFVVSLSYDASELPIWNLYSFALPGSHIQRHATIRIGGL